MERLCFDSDDTMKQKENSSDIRLCLVSHLGVYVGIKAEHSGGKSQLIVAHWSGRREVDGGDVTRIDVVNVGLDKTNFAALPLHFSNIFPLTY